LAARYARALFEIARQRGEAAAVTADLAACAASLSAALPLLRDPRIGADEKKALVRDSLGGRSAPLVADFLDLLIEKKRFDLLTRAAADLQALLAQEQGVATAQVRVARALSEDDRRRLRESLGRLSGCRVELVVKEEAGLLGGMAVRLGDWVLDGSLRGQLQRLKEAISGD
jgi:F-type H+-transporting ATPase subunit delta